MNLMESELLTELFVFVDSPLPRRCVFCKLCDLNCGAHALCVCCYFPEDRRYTVREKNAMFFRECWRYAINALGSTYFSFHDDTVFSATDAQSQCIPTHLTCSSETALAAVKAVASGSTDVASVKVAAACAALFDKQKAEFLYAEW